LPARIARLATRLAARAYKQAADVSNSDNKHIQTDRAHLRIGIGGLLGDSLHNCNASTIVSQHKAGDRLKTAKLLGMRFMMVSLSRLLITRSESGSRMTSEG
jgi:hypothetical protein